MNRHNQLKFKLKKNFSQNNEKSGLKVEFTRPV